MPVTNEEKEFVSYIVDLMQIIGPVRSRPMFGGFGIFLNNLMFGLVVNGVLYLKVDRITRPAFEARDLEAFSYLKNNKPVAIAYYQAPEEALENSEDMALWAKQAYDVALNTKKPNK
jgi:DNA transformation protein